jgi:hypothetical protein
LKSNVALKQYLDHFGAVFLIRKFRARLVKSAAGTTAALFMDWQMANSVLALHGIGTQIRKYFKQ